DAQQVGAVELADELDDLVLRGGVVAELGEGEVPGGLDIARAIERADEVMGDGVEAVELVGGGGVNDVPAPAAVVLAGAWWRGGEVAGAWCGRGARKVRMLGALREASWVLGAGS